MGRIYRIPVHGPQSGARRRPWAYDELPRRRPAPRDPWEDETPTARQAPTPQRDAFGAGPGFPFGPATRDDRGADTPSDRAPDRAHPFEADTKAETVADDPPVRETTDRYAADADEGAAWDETAEAKPAESPRPSIPDRNTDASTEADRNAEGEPDAGYRAALERTQADFANYRRRMDRDRALDRERAVAEFLRDFLDAMDDLNRVVTHGAEEAGGESILTGARLARDNMRKRLRDAGVEEVPAAGEHFDPAVHEALTAAPAPGVAPGTVIEVERPGYRLGETLIRPARVIVAREG